VNFNLSYRMPGDDTVKQPPNPLQSMALAGCTAVIAVNFTHPIETYKTRLQVNGSGYSLANMIKTEGYGSLYKGIQAAYLREMSYTTVKLGGYGPIRDALGAGAPGSPFYLKFLAGSMSGSIGSVFGNPFDVFKTMMMANAGKAVPLPTLFTSLVKEQGVGGLYRGIQANIARACVLNGTKMACYDTIKGMVVEKTGWSRKDPRTQFTGSVGAGFFMTCTVAPFDMLRTTLMNQPVDKKIYNGLGDAAIKIMKAEGPQAFYRGFFPIWVVSPLKLPSS